MEVNGEKNVFSCSLSGDLESLQRLLECKSSSDINISNILQEKDDTGRNVLFTACMLGRSSILRELVKHEADVNERTPRGYSPLHCSALWGQLDTVKTLIELGADTQMQNFRGETAKDVACRYSKVDCADYLAWAEAKFSLQAYISQVRKTIADPEKVQGKLNNEDKNICLNTCSAKADWIQNAKNPSVQDFTEQREHLEDILSPILAKVTALHDAKAGKNGSPIK